MEFPFLPTVRAFDFMPYLFTCPHCQARTEVEDTYSGRSGQCVVCAGAITVPDFAKGVTGDGGVLVPPRSRGRFPIVWIVVAGLLLVMVGAGLVAAVRFGGSTASRMREGRLRLSSIRNLEAIASAMNAYASDHGSYPPPVLRDDSGKALHSWRVLLLPYLGEEDLYRQIDLSVPWDQGRNQSLGYGAMPSVYRHPTMQGWSSETNYYLVTGPGTLFPANGPLGPDRIPDGKSKTILVVEAAGQSVSSQWLEPVDLDVVVVGGSINANPGQDLGGVTPGGVCVATADGRAWFLDESISKLTVQSLLTPAGDEPLPDDVLD